MGSFFIFCRSYWGLHKKKKSERSENDGDRLIFFPVATRVNKELGWKKKEGCAQCCVQMFMQAPGPPLDAHKSHSEGRRRREGRVIHLCCLDPSTACLPACLGAFVLPYLPTCLPACLPAYSLTCLFIFFFLMLLSLLLSVCSRSHV